MIFCMFELICLVRRSIAKVDAGAKTLAELGAKTFCLVAASFFVLLWLAKFMKDFVNKKMPYS